MDLEDLGIFSFLFIIPYTIALQILLITFIRKYVDARREIFRIKQDIHNEQAVAAGRVYHAETHVPAVPQVQTVPGFQPAPAVQPVPAVPQVPEVQPASAPKKRSRISSTSITFGVGVLLLTIVGAAFLSVSWSFMGNAARAVTLIAAVAVVYFLSFLSGKVLKLKQTGFAFYTLGSFLGPIVVVGVGMFRLLGKWFSFSGGNGWLVAAVASLLMALSAIIGKYIYKSNFYTGITYFSFTWLVVFVSGQIGEESKYVYPYECIFIAIALLAVILRVILACNPDFGKLSFKIYAETVTFGSVLMMLISVPVALADGSNNTFILIGSVLANVALILHARFTPKREWVTKMAPFAALCLFFAIVCFDDYKYPNSAWMVFVLFAVLYVVFFLTKIRTLLSDVLFTTLPVIFMLISDDYDQIYVPVIIMAGLAVIMSAMSAYFAKTKPSGGINAALAASWYYIMSVELMVMLIGDRNETRSFLLAMPIPVATAIVLTVIRRFVKDDHRIRIASEVLTWAALLFGTVALIGAQNYNKLRSFRTLFTRDVAVMVSLNGILLLLTSLLLAYNYFLNAKKKGAFSIPTLIVSALALNAPAYVAFVPGILLGMARAHHHGFNVAYCVMFAIMAAVLVLIRFAPLFKKEVLVPYAKPMKHIVSAMLCVWTVISLTDYDCKWMIIAMPLVLLALYFCGNEFFAAIPMLIFQASIAEFFSDAVRIESKDLNNIVFVLLILGQFAIGRLFYRKKIISGAGIDYLAFMPLILAMAFKDTDYITTVAYLILALMIFNFLGRTRIPARIIASIATVPVAAALIDQDYINLYKAYMDELYLAIILADAALIRFLIKPAQEKVMKYSWFAIVSGCIVFEGISAAITGYTFDLIVTGVAAGGIFLFSFIQKSRLWFILGVVSIIGIAVYLSATFWSSMAWLLYLLIAGIIMIVIAAGNEWRKRHSSDGKKLFKEWKW